MLPLVMGAMALGGGLLQGFGAYQQGQFQGEMADFNARQSMLDAKIAQQNADAQAKALRQQGRQLTGTQRTRYAKSGLRMEGTPLEVMAKTAENIELDAIAMKQKGAFEAAQHKAQSQFTSSMGDAQERAGTLGFVSGVLGGATSAMGMF